MTRASPGGRQGEPERLGELLQPARGNAWPRERRLAAIWPEVVGAEVAQHSRPAGLRAGKLSVSTSSPVWAQTLQLMAEKIIERLNRLFGEHVVERMVFRAAGWEDGAVAHASADGEGLRARSGSAPRRKSAATGAGSDRASACSLTSEQLQAVEEVRRAGCDPELEQRIIAAMEACFRAGG